MRRLTLAVLFMFAVRLLHATACPGGYTTLLTIKVNPQAGLSADVTNWPMVFICGNAHCKSTGNGGDVTDSGAKDVVFCDAATSGNVLSYELVPSSYSATAGTAEWWIKLPTIPKTSSTTYIYAMVGKASPTDYSCNTAGSASCGTALFPSCQLIFHSGYDNGSSSALSLVDSCGNASATNVTNVLKDDHTTFPPVYEAMAGNGSYINSGYQPTLTGSWSVEEWTATSSALQYEMGNLDGSTNGVYLRGNRDLSTCPNGLSGNCLTATMANAGSYITKICGTDMGVSGVWHHGLATHTAGSTGQIALYTDGAACTATTFASSGTVSNAGSSAVTFKLFNYGSGGAGAIGLDESRVYNAVVTADQAYIDYTCEKNPTSCYSITSSPITAGVPRHSGRVF